MFWVPEIFSCCLLHFSGVCAVDDVLDSVLLGVHVRDGNGHHAQLLVTCLLWTQDTLPGMAGVPQYQGVHHHLHQDCAPCHAQE